MQAAETAGLPVLAWTLAKFIGGPQTPGVLVVRRDLVRNQVPTVCGAG